MPFNVNLDVVIPTGLDVCGFRFRAVLSGTTDCDGTAMHFVMDPAQPQNWHLSENCEASGNGVYSIAGVINSATSTSFLKSGRLGAVSLTHRGCRPCACQPIFNITVEEFVACEGAETIQVVLETASSVTICTTPGNCD